MLGLGAVTGPACLEARDASRDDEDIAVVGALKVAGGQDRVVICHVAGCGRMHAQELTVARSAVVAHLKHGDSEGPCGFCVRQPDGVACDDGNPCTDGDACSNGACSGTPRVCGGGDSCTIASSVCDPAVGNCVLTPRPDGTPCDDQNICTEAETCRSGVCGGGTTPGVVSSGTTTTYTCPPTATAEDGIVHFTCGFLYSFAPNNVFTGEVFLISHLERGYADFDVLNSIEDGTLQLACVYQNADGLQIGGIYTETRPAGGCVASSADTFTCTN